MYCYKIAEEVGLARERVKEVLENDEFAEEVKAILRKLDKSVSGVYRFSLLTVNMQFQAHNLLKHLQKHFGK